MKKKINKLFKYLNDNVILIYQMGKVGSTSIEKSLKKEYKNKSYEVIHTHGFYYNLVYQSFKDYKVTNKFYHPFLRRLEFKLNGLIRKFILKRKRKLKVITLAREPVSRNISMFFQNIHIPVSEISMFDIRKEEYTNFNIFEELFLNKFNHSYGIKWFDKELKKSLGINVYNYEFNKEKGFSIIKKDNIDLMIIKTEKLNEVQKEISTFLEIEEFQLLDENISTKKWYADLYKRFKNNFLPSKEYIDMLFNSKYMRHFYSNQEIKQFKNKWLRK